MSRRDTIILAVLLNTGLLAILFVLAINPSDDYLPSQGDAHPAFVEVQKQPATPLPPPVAVAHDASSDEVDNVLKDFAATLHNQSLESPMRRMGEPQSDLVAMNTAAPTPISSRPRIADEVKSPKVDPSFVEVTIKRGDILGRIAQANNTTVSAIKKANNLVSDNLQIGQVLRVPVGSAKKANVAKRPSYTDDGFNRYYTIESGDNPWKIAKKFNVSVREFLNLNDLNEAKARNLKPGDRVRVQ